MHKLLWLPFKYFVLFLHCTFCFACFDCLLCYRYRFVIVNALTRTAVHTNKHHPPKRSNSLNSLLCLFALWCVTFVFLWRIRANFPLISLANCFTVTRGKKKKKRKAFAKLTLAGTLIKAKIELLLKILGAHLQIKFFAIALIGLLINIARFWIDVKRGGTPSKVSWRLPDESNEFSLCSFVLEQTQGWKTKQCFLLFYHTTINESSAPCFQSKIHVYHI